MDKTILLGKDLLELSDICIKNNLPKYIRESDDEGDLRNFLNLIGEHFDLIRNHIDNYRVHNLTILRNHIDKMNIDKKD